MNKLFEHVDGNKFQLVNEDRWARHNPEGPEVTDMESHSQWDNPTEAKKLMKYLLQCIDAGNFDLANETLEKLASIHN